MAKISSRQKKSPICKKKIPTKILCHTVVGVQTNIMLIANQISPCRQYPVYNNKTDPHEIKNLGQDSRTESKGHKPYPVQQHLSVRENEPALIPRKSGWTRAISFVGLSQSCYRLQIFVWQRLSQKLSHQNRKSFLPCFLDPSHGEAISTARRHRRNSRV